jgi:two-component system phosphate regulon sensor histidine kinase PhoR
MPLIDALLAGLPLPVLIVGPDLRIARMNPAAVALLGDGLTGRHFTAAVRQPELVDQIERTLSGTGAPGSQVRVTLAAAGHDTVYRVLVAPLAGEGASLAFEDITDIEKAGAIRRDFVANVSHELRTPLTALSGFIETLKGAARDDPAARERFLAIMEREAARMNRLVGDLLSLSRVEAEERVRPSELVDIAALAAGSVAALRGMATEARVRLEIHAAPGVPEVFADPDQMTQVLQNLIENAVKYGGSGGSVEVFVDHDPESAAMRGGAIVISVVDHGEGIHEVHLPRLTERFYRVDSHRSREKGGTGLGLAIVKHIVNRHRGRLRIESRPGEGSRFEVILPAAQAGGQRPA